MSTDTVKITELERQLHLLRRGCLIVIAVAVVSIFLSWKALHKVSADGEAGAVQRVTTISQRCDLTSKITAVLTKDDPVRLPAFQLSYEECELGLRKAEHLAGVKAKRLTP